MNTILIFLGIIILIIVVKFTTEYDKDKTDLQFQPIQEKFRVIVNMINETAFNGTGSVTKIDTRSINLYKAGENQIINFMYSTGHLTITWRYKYFQKEVVHEKLFSNVRNLSLFEQEKIASVMINEMSQVVEKHKVEVLEGSNY